MSFAPDNAGALAMRTAWHERLRDIDPHLAEPDVRTFLASQSWNDTTFQLQHLALQRVLLHGQQQGLSVELHRWALSRHAYDFITEPLYQYLVLCTLNGLWFDATPQERTSGAFGQVCARATTAWSFARHRGEPRAAASAVGWVMLPYAWDDLMQLAVEGFLAGHPGGQSHRLFDLANRPNQTDDSPNSWRAAWPCWQGLVAKMAVGAVGVPLPRESHAVEHLVLKHPAFLGGRLHQNHDHPAQLGNILAHLGVAYTVAHETAHVLAARWHADHHSSIRRDPLAWETLADSLALRGLWNYNGATAPHTNDDDSEALLWLASGVFFYMGLAIYENGGQAARCAAGFGADDGYLQRSAIDGVRSRLHSFVALATKMAERLRGPEQAEVARALEHVSQLLRQVVPYINACSDFCRQWLPLAIDELKSWVLVDPQGT